MLPLRRRPQGGTTIRRREQFEFPGRSKQHRHRRIALLRARQESSNGEFSAGKAQLLMSDRAGVDGSRRDPDQGAANVRHVTALEHRNPGGH
ncbi:hypothetical protein GCM10009551_056860 [Nocardiopsis tropica]